MFLARYKEIMQVVLSKFHEHELFSIFFLDSWNFFECDFDKGYDFHKFKYSFAEKNTILNYHKFRLIVSFG